jgi:hypothetical protein
MAFYGFFTDESDRSLGYHFSDLLNLLIQTVLSTLIVLMTAEFAESFFQIYANGLIKLLCQPMFSICYFISFRVS